MTLLAKFKACYSKLKDRNVELVRVGTVFSLGYLGGRHKLCPMARSHGRTSQISNQGNTCEEVLDTQIQALQFGHSSHRHDDIYMVLLNTILNARPVQKTSFSLGQRTCLFASR